MADNGEGTYENDLGYKVKIPAIFVNHEQGEKLVKTIEKVKGKGEKLIVKVNF